MKIDFNRFRSRLIVVLASLLMIPIWGLSFLSMEYANQLTVLYGMSLTGAVFIWLKNKFQKSDPLFYPLSSIGPFCYLLATVVFQGSLPLEELLLNPILFALIIVIISLVLNQENKFSNYVLGGLIISYSLLIFPEFIKGRQLSNLSFDRLIEKNTEIAELDLSDFPTLFSEIKRRQENKAFEFILIETWNEKCKPCLESMKDLQNFVKQNQNVLHLFLYQKMGSQNLNEEEIRKFKLIENKENILIDVNNDFYRRMKLSSYPYFFIYSKSGKQLDWFSGYLTYFKEEYQEHLRNIIVEDTAIE